MKTVRIPPTEGAWLTSNRVRKSLKISSCTLAHLREAGRLQFIKKGNAFLYSKNDVEAMISQMPAR